MTIYRQYSTTKGVLDANAVKVRVNAQSNVTIATPGATINGITMNVGDLFTTGVQSTTTQDGLYVYQGASSPATRAPRLPAGASAAGLLCVIEEGTDADKLLLCTNDVGSDVVGTDNLTFALLNSGAPRMKAFLISAPAAAGVAVHAAIASDNASAVTTGITNPAIPRAVQIVFHASWDGGDVTIVGTDQFDNAQTEVIADTAGSTVQGVKVWKTITSINQETVGAGGTAVATVQTGTKIGLLTAISDTAFGLAHVDGAADNATFNATYNSVLFTSAPNGSKNYVVAYNIT